MIMFGLLRFKSKQLPNELPRSLHLWNERFVAIDQGDQQFSNQKNFKIYVRTNKIGISMRFIGFKNSNPEVQENTYSWPFLKLSGSMSTFITNLDYYNRFNFENQMSFYTSTYRSFFADQEIIIWLANSVLPPATNMWPIWSVIQRMTKLLLYRKWFSSFPFSYV